MEAEGIRDGPVAPGDLVPGAKEFNAGNYFEAHEAWEKTWYGTEGEESRFLKGLIQIAVSLYHLETGNLDGARKVLTTALGYLEEFPSPRCGVDLENLKLQVRPILTELEAGRDPYPLLESDPVRIRLQV
jgi:hypothetical protein